MGALPAGASNIENHRSRGLIQLEAAPMSLTGKQRRYLRGLGHALDPVVHLGKEGITDGVVKAVGAALLDHELIKLKIGQECPIDRHEVSEQLPTRAQADLVQLLGRTMLLYKRHPKKPEIKLPRE